MINNKYKVNATYKKVILSFIDFFLFFLKQKKIFPSKIKSILVIRLDNLGDILLTRPLMCSLKKAYPLAKVDVLLKGKSVNLLSKDRWINNVFFYSKETIKTLMDNNYDLVIEPKGRLDYAYLTWKLKPKYSIGFGDAGGGAFFNFALYQVNQNQMEKNMMVCKELAIKYEDQFPDILIEQALMSKYKKYQNYIAINPFTSREEKDWAINNFLELAQLLTTQGYKVVFLAETSKEQELVPFIKDKTEFLLFSKEQLFEFIAVIKLSKLLIAPDSASIHIAAAVGTKSIGLFGPENPELWHPYNQDVNSFIKKSDNINDIDVSDVLLEIDKLLGIK
jgi:ADP-heptose:LPS heptosyltransferase